MQKHWDVMRSDDAGDSWHEVSGNLPTDFGFPIAVHAHEPETIYVVPIKSDSEHYPPEGKLRVYRSRTGGNEWEALTNGLPQSDCYVNVLRSAMAVDTLELVRHLFRHHRRAGVRLGRLRRPLGADRPRPAAPCCRSRSRRCHDPRHAPRPSAAGWPTSTAKCNIQVEGPATIERGPGRAGSPVPDAARDDPRPHHQTAPAVHPLLCLRPGSVARAAGCPPARGGGNGRRAPPGGGGHGRRVIEEGWGFQPR